MPHYWGNTSLTIRTDLAPEYAKSQSWDILFDPKYKGRISVLDGVDDVVPFIAKMIGIDAYTMTDAQWQQVQAKLRELMPQLRVVSADNATLEQGLASGELVAAMSWRTTFAHLNHEHKPVAYLNPPGGMFTYVCGLVMHKDPSNEAKALALIDAGIADDAARLHGDQDRRRARQHRGDEDGARRGLHQPGPDARPGRLPEKRHLPAPAAQQGQDRRRLDRDQKRRAVVSRLPRTRTRPSSCWRWPAWCCTPLPTAITASSATSCISSPAACVPIGVMSISRRWCRCWRLGRTALSGDNVWLFRLLPMLVTAATAALTAEFARMTGGGRFAQWLAGVCVLLAPFQLLRTCSIPTCSSP